MVCQLLCIYLILSLLGSLLIARWFYVASGPDCESEQL